MWRRTISTAFALAVVTTPAHAATITEYRLPAAAAAASSVAVTPDGSVWLGGYGMGAVVRQRPDRSTYERHPAPDTDTLRMTALPGGRLGWSDADRFVTQYDPHTRALARVPGYGHVVGVDLQSGGVIFGSVRTLERMAPDGSRRPITGGVDGMIFSSVAGLEDGTVVASGDVGLYRIDPDAERWTRLAPGFGNPGVLTPMAVAGERVVVLSGADQRLLLGTIDIRTGAAVATRVGRLESHIGVGLSVARTTDGALWTSDADSVIRVDPVAGARAQYAIPSGGDGGYVAGMAAGPDGSLWITEYSPTLPARLTRIRPGGNRIVAELASATDGGIATIVQCTAACLVKTQLFDRNRKVVARGSAARGDAGPVHPTAVPTPPGLTRPGRYTLIKRRREGGRTTITKTAVVLRASTPRLVRTARSPKSASDADN